MSDQWKKLERKVARKLGGKRVYRMGNWGEGKVDVDHPVFSIECKEGKQVPKFYYKAMQQAKLYDLNKVPIVVSHRYREREAMVTMRLKDFEEFFGA